MHYYNNKNEKKECSVGTRSRRVIVLEIPPSDLHKGNFREQSVILNYYSFIYANSNRHILLLPTD